LTSVKDTLEGASEDVQEILEKDSGSGD
jgi:hypothetical protein